MSTSWIVFACVFGGALLGIFLHAVLPEHHLSEESRSALNLVIGLIGTMAALVLGLLVATAQGSFSTRNGEFTQMSANVILMDRMLALYGPETREARELLRGAVTRWLHQSSFESGTSKGGEVLYKVIQGLSPKNDSQRWLQAQVLTMAFNLGQTRWLLFEQSGSSIPTAFLVVLAFWLSVIFASFGLFAPRNATVVVALFVGALSVSGAIFLILELDQPFHGFMQISDASLRNALAQLGQ
jgi:hypothetical protein